MLYVLANYFVDMKSGNSVVQRAAEDEMQEMYESGVDLFFNIEAKMLYRHKFGKTDNYVCYLIGSLFHTPRGISRHKATNSLYRPSMMQTRFSFLIAFTMVRATFGGCISMG